MAEPEPIKVYNLGEHGVNLVKSPLHLDDGELTQAQNAEFYREQGRGALRKRPALRRVNGSALAGTVGGVVGVPLPSVSERYVYAATSWNGMFGAGAWQRYNAGAWSVSPGQVTGAYYRQLTNECAEPVLVVGRQFYYLAFDSSNLGRVLAFDGEVEYEAFRLIPDVTGRTMLLCAANGRVYAAQSGRTALDGAVYEYNPATGGLRQIANTSIFPSGVNDPITGTFYLGRLFIGTRGDLLEPTPGAKVYSARVDDATWVEEDTGGVGIQNYNHMAVYRGELYVGTGADSTVNAIIRKRTVAGVWSTSKSDSSTLGEWTSLRVFNDRLFAVYHNAGVLEVWVYDGTTWTLDKDLYVVTASTHVGGMAQLGSILYVTTTGDATDQGQVWTRTTAGVWTDISGLTVPGTGGLIGVL